MVENVWKLAHEAEVKQLVMFHHDPDRTDDELDTLLIDTKNWFEGQRSNVVCHVAYEGLELIL